MVGLVDSEKKFVIYSRFDALQTVTDGQTEDSEYVLYVGGGETL